MIILKVNTKKTMAKTVEIIIKDNGVILDSIAEVITTPEMSETLDDFIVEHLGGRPTGKR